MSLRGILTIIVSAFFYITAQAQNSTTIKIWGGLGSGSVVEKGFISGKTRTNSKVSMISCISAGYDISAIRISIGAGITGSSYSNDVTIADFDPTTGLPIYSKATFHKISRRIILPITVAYKWSVTERLTLVPELGFMPAYNMGIISKIEKNGTDNVESNTEKPGKSRRLFSLSGIAALHFEYYVTEHIGFCAGAAYTQALTNLLKVPDNVPFKASERENTYTGNLGVVFKL